jgi:hypothetical protein
MIDILLGMALLIPPPEPPPPPDRLAAAAELRRLAPFSGPFRDHALDRAAWRAASEALRHPGLENRHADFIAEARARIAVRLAAGRGEVEARADRCLDERNGHAFDLSVLQEMARIVPTKGGHALWEQAMREPAQNCYDESVRFSLAGVTPSLSWVAVKGLLGRLPRHDPARGIPPSLPGELEALRGTARAEPLRSAKGCWGSTRNGRTARPGAAAAAGTRSSAWSAWPGFQVSIRSSSGAERRTGRPDGRPASSYLSRSCLSRARSCLAWTPGSLWKSLATTRPSVPAGGS